MNNNTSKDSSGPRDILIERYKIVSSWSFHLFEGIQLRIEKEQPDLIKEAKKIDGME